MSSSANMESGGNGVLTVTSDGSLTVLRKDSDAKENTISKHSVVALPKTDGSVGLYCVPSEGPSKGQMFLVLPGAKPSEGKGWKAESTPESTSLVPLFNNTSSSQNTVPIQGIVVPSKKSLPTILPAIKSQSIPPQINFSSSSALQAVSSHQEVTHGIQATQKATSFASSKTISSNSMILTQSVPDSIVNSTTSTLRQTYIVHPKPRAPVIETNAPRPIWMFSHEAAASLGSGTPNIALGSTVSTKSLNVTTKPLIKEIDSSHEKLSSLKSTIPSKNITVIQHPANNQHSNAVQSNKIIPHEQESDSKVKTSTTSGLQNSDTANSSRRLILCYPANGKLKTKVSSSDSDSTNKDVISMPLQKQNLTSQENTLTTPSVLKLRLSTSSTCNSQPSQITYSPPSPLITASRTKGVKVIMCSKSQVSTPGAVKSLLNPSHLQVIKKPVVSPLVSTPTATSSNSVTEPSSLVNNKNCVGSYPTILNVNSIFPDQKVKPKLVLNSGQRPEYFSTPTIIKLQSEKPATNITLTKLSHCDGTSNKPTLNSKSTQQLIGKTDMKLSETSSKPTKNDNFSFTIAAPEGSCQDASHQSFNDKGNDSKPNTDNASNSETPIVIDSVFSLASNDCDSEQKEENQKQEFTPIDSDMQQLEDFVLREFDFLSHFQGIVLPDDIITDSQIFAPCYVVLERMQMRNMKISGISKKCTNKCRAEVVRRKSDIRLFIQRQTKKNRKEERKKLKTKKKAMMSNKSETKFEMSDPVITHAPDVYRDTPTQEGTSGLALTNNKPGCSIDKTIDTNKRELEMKTSPPAHIPLVVQQFETGNEASASATASESITAESKASKLQKFFMIKVDNKSVLIPVNAGKCPKAFVFDNKTEKGLGLDKCLIKSDGEDGVVSSQSDGKSPVVIKAETQNSAEQSMNLNSVYPTPNKKVKTSAETKPVIKSEPVTSGYGDEPPKLFPVVKVKQEPMNRGYPDENPKKRSEVPTSAINNDSSPPKLTRFDETPTTQSKEDLISSLKELLRQKERELEEVRRKRASEPPIFVDMDF